MDEDPRRNELGNLAVLCLDCHNDTQLRGGFGRRLIAEQVILYRDDWHRLVVRNRADVELAQDDVDTRDSVKLALSIAEIYRENGEYELLASHYHHRGSTELRGKYIERAPEGSPRDSTITWLRGLQGRRDLIPEDVVERELARYEANDDKLRRARFLRQLGRYRRAVLDYVEGIAESLKEDRVFSAAFYLKELANEIAMNPSQAMVRRRPDEMLKLSGTPGRSWPAFRRRRAASRTALGRPAA